MNYIDYELNTKLIFCKKCNKWVKIVYTTVTRCPACGNEIFSSETSYKNVIMDPDYGIGNRS